MANSIKSFLIHDENPRVPSEDDSRAPRRTPSARRGRVHRRRSRRDRAPSGRCDRRRQGADSRGRTREGRRRQARAIGRGCRNARPEHAGQEAGDEPDRPRRPHLLALDAKMNFDDSALYRHTDIRDLRDLGEEDPLEIEASKFALNYVHLDGNIGCMVNGAGLAMATMDIIKLAGGEPANFLDVGGGANAEQIRNAFKILMSDKNVKAVLINIFGGILRCDILAQGVIAAVKDLGVPVPIVIRMEGTNVDAGKRLLRESGMKLTTADSMDEAAAKVVQLAG